MISYGVSAIGRSVLTRVVYIMCNVAGVSMILPTASASLGHCGKPKTSDAVLICILTASVSAGSSDCGRQIRIQSGQDDLLDVVNRRPRRDLLPRFAFTIPSYLILREGRE